MQEPRANERAFSFRLTPSVEASRDRPRYVDCSICGADHSQYLFHRVGVRFVRCRSCGMVYVNPVGEARVNWFDIEGSNQLADAHEISLFRRNFVQILERIEARYIEVEGKPLTKVVLVGRFMSGLTDSDVARRIGLSVVPAKDADFQRVSDAGDLSWARGAFDGAQVVISSELLEACSEPRAALEKLVAMVPPGAWIVHTYSSAASLPSALLRRYWPSFFDVKRSFFTTSNMAALMAKVGYVITGQFPYPVTHTLRYVLDRVTPGNALASAMSASPVGNIAMRLRTGASVAMFRKPLQPVPTKEKLSIILPIFNEHRYAAQVIEAVLGKTLKIDKELIIVESNSTDGTREIVQTFAGRPGVRIILEDKPQGKGHAVKSGLAAVKGTIVLIQDADFEYDIDDYDALLEPILQRRTSFVLGSRSLGLDDWKVRRFEGTAVRRFLLNAAQVAFAQTFNVLYQQKTTDVNTMFKVFRSECIEGLDLESNGFNLDIELACKLVRNGNAPIEVPVNYVARGFAEGKKISFVRDALPSYAAFFRYRFK